MGFDDLFLNENMHILMHYPRDVDSNTQNMLDYDDFAYMLEIMCFGKFCEIYRLAPVCVWRISVHSGFRRPLHEREHAHPHALLPQQGLQHPERVGL